MVVIAEEPSVAKLTLIALEATEIAKDCPHIANEGNVEVREIAPMPAM